MKLIKVMEDQPPDQLAAIVDEAHELGLAVAGHSRDACDPSRVART